VEPDSPYKNKWTVWSDQEVKARLLRRALGRLRRSTPGKFDGDRDGFVYNPATGRDDMPAPRRSMVPRQGSQPRRVRFAERMPTAPTMRSYSNQWSDGDDDPLEEMNRSLGIGVPNAADRMTAAAREMAERRREQGAAFSPVEVDRKKIRVNGISRNTFLDLMDDLIDYTKKLKDDPIEERDNKRVWKLLFAMQKLENLNGVTQSGDGIDLNLSEDELKRLYKGLQSLINNLGEWSDNEDAQQLYSQIKKLYNRGWSNAKQLKSPNADLDFKILGMRLGRRGRRAFRRGRGAARSARDRIDGDGDGFTTNPVTGRDDVPLANAPEVAKPKKPITATDVGLMSMRSRARMLETSRRATRARTLRSDSSGGGPSIADMMQQLVAQMNSPRSHDEAKEWLFQSLGKSRIKDRSWYVFQKRIKAIEDELQQKYGDPKTLSDFIDAFQKLNPDVKIKGFDEDLSPKEIGFLKGILFTMTKFPNRYNNASKLRITKRTPENPGQAGGTRVKPKFRASKAGGARVLSGDKVEFEFNEVIDFAYDRRIPPVDYTDGVTNQLMKAYVRENRDKVSPEDLMRRASELSGMGTGIHEGVHAVHYLAAHEDALPANMNPQQVMDMIDDLIENNFDEYYENLMYVRAHNDFLEALKYISMFSIEEPGVDEAMLQKIKDAEDAGDFVEAAGWRQARANRLEALKYTEDFKNILGQAKFEDIRAALTSKALPDPSDDENFFMAKAQLLINEVLLDNKEKIVDFIEELHTINEGYASVDDFRKDLRTNIIDTEIGFGQAQMQLTMRKLWDDLTKSEISDIRKVWRYISSYAKDKNSMYGGTTFTASVEGAAEGMLLQILGFGLPEDKLSPKSIAAFNKWMMWLAGKDY
jgi:hypothetical protein